MPGTFVALNAALANVELFLEMARAYDARGLKAFAEAMRVNWNDAQKEMEGRPDAEADAVAIITMHSAKGLEWPIVIPINSPTELDDKHTYLHCRFDNTVHFKLLGMAGPDYEQVKNDERHQVKRERIRLWYVALTRASDLLLLPRQSQRSGKDWFSLLGTTPDDLPVFDSSGYSGVSPSATPENENLQDKAAWTAEAQTIAATRRTIAWRSPSRHEAAAPETAPEEDVFTDTAVISVPLGLTRKMTRRWKRSKAVECGLVLHKLIEEVLTGETVEVMEILEARARTLLDQLGATEAASAEEGPSPLSSPPQRYARWQYRRSPLSSLPTPGNDRSIG